MIGPELIAIAIFLFTYALIIDERIHRAVAAMLGASVIVFLHIVPWEKIPVYVDLGTIFLLMGMMIIVGVLKQTGIFEFLGVWAAKKSRGHPYRLMVMFMLITAIASPILDNVTIIMLVVPVLLALPLGSVTCHWTVRAPLPGVSLVELKVTALSAACHWARLALALAEDRLSAPVLAS